MIVKGEGVTKIGKEDKVVSFPPAARSINISACRLGAITFLDLECTQIIIIGESAFESCRNLISASFPSCLTKICKMAFCGCNTLKQIKFNDDSKLRKIGSFCFQNCYQLYDAALPQQLEIIGLCAFESCPFLKKINLKSTKVKHVAKITNLQFDRPYVSFPATISMKSIFDNYICDFSVDEMHPHIKKDVYFYYFFDGTIFNGNKKTKHIFIRRSVKVISIKCFESAFIVKLSIPASVNRISKSAFENCRFLKNIIFLKNSQLLEIQKNAFRGCSSLKKINFPKLLKYIKNGAFNYCSELEKVNFPIESQLEKLEISFYNTSIKELKIPQAVREIKSFCTGLTRLKSIFINNDLFMSNKEGTAILSKDGSELILVISSIKEFEIPNGVRVIKTGAFSDSSITGRLFIPDSVEIIKFKAFYYCTKLKIIEFGYESKLKMIETNFTPFINKEIKIKRFKEMYGSESEFLHIRRIIFDAPSMMV